MPTKRSVMSLDPTSRSDTSDDLVIYIFNINFLTSQEFI